MSRARRFSAIAAAAAGVLALALAWRLLPLTVWLRSLEDRVASMGSTGLLVYGAVYIAAVLLFVPGIVLTLGAGFLFGFVRGCLLVSAASTIAAALAFLIARHLARARIERWARGRPEFEAIDRAVGDNGWKIVALLRLSPLVPFSLSNYFYGLTSVRFVPYVLTSWLAMLPATLVYVSLGAAGRSVGTGTHRTPAEWTLLAAGLAATVAVTITVTRIARRELARLRITKGAGEAA
ncbi:MAG TPA: VTT domain-containing protein [Thermoanaerobaculia bacterium]